MQSLLKNDYSHESLLEPLPVGIADIFLNNSIPILCVDFDSLFDKTTTPVFFVGLNPMKLENVPVPPS